MIQNPRSKRAEILNSEFFITLNSFYIRVHNNLLSMKCFLASVMVILFCAQGFSQNRTDSLIEVLKYEIENQDVYVSTKVKRIEKLRLSLRGIDSRSNTEQFQIYNSLYHEYKTFINDSAFHYAKHLIATAYKLNDRSLIGYARVKVAFLLLSSGMFKETFDTLKRVEVKYLTDTMRVDHYRLLARAYSDLAVYNKSNHYEAVHHELDNVYTDSALMWSKPGSYIHFYLTSINELHTGNFENVVTTVNKLMSAHQLTHPQLAINYYDMAEACGKIGDENRMLEFLIMSSLSDLRAPTKETAAMYTLARLLYNRGDSENAYVFIKQALSDAEFYGARQRKVEISSILPLIAAAQLNSMEAQRLRWLIYSAGITLIVILVVVFSVIIFKQLKKLKAAEAVITKANSELHEMNQKLLEADKIKEEYIGYYFNNNSEYIDKIASFKRSIDRKLQHHKVDDIKHVVSTINPDHEREELYYNFDRIFLKLFPDFVDMFNSYFDAENRIVLKEGQLLNTELRIFALIRLGIHDAEKIARILGYSVNTIYAYRNRVKSKSTLPNELFEQKIMEIKTVPAGKSSYSVNIFQDHVRA
jgi:DNA-binding CsgD family transcriptional regulator